MVATVCRFSRFHQRWYAEATKVLNLSPIVIPWFAKSAVEFGSIHSRKCYSSQTRTDAESTTKNTHEFEESSAFTGNGNDELPESGSFANSDYVSLTPLQKAIIYVGSGVSSFFDPTRAENIATFGEISALPVLPSLRHKMLSDPESARILAQKPRINSKTVDLEYLSKLAPETLGGYYIQFLRKNKVTPDSRLPVQFIKDPELAYVMQRYREIHDLVHTVTGQPTNMLGEVVVKWIEGIQTGLPMCLTGGLFGATRLRPKQRSNYEKTHLRWALEVGFNSKPFLNIFYEERWEQPMDELRYDICPLLLSPPKFVK